jgi:hypothetical protein
MAGSTRDDRNGTHARAGGDEASRKVAKAMHEMKAGTLRSGSGRKVTQRAQAVAIGLSEARKEGAKVPPEPRSSGRKAGRQV